ncbi:MAG: transglutaminase-like domain-containing protein [Terriglobales bacterium]
MIVSFFPPGGAAQNEFNDWSELGTWYSNLASGRFDASSDIKQKVAALTSSLPSPVAKMRAVANFVQHDIRYVAIELGIGGYQPHPASDVFMHHYGDCKDKATLMKSMLREMGVDSYYVVINAERGGVTAKTPANVDGFNHVIIAIRLPEGVNDPSLIATIQHPKLGRLLFFDPTNDLTPFGQIGGYLQANYGLLVTPTGGELVELPEEPATMNSIQRTAIFHLDPSGRLQGDVKEIRLGDRASDERWALHTVTNDKDRIKPIEDVLAGSLSTFRITKASIINLNLTNQPFGFDYSFDADNYAKTAGDLLLVRLRAIGIKSSALLETKDPRMFPVEFDGPSRDTDTFDITVPPGYTVDDLPPAVDADYGFADYHSKSAVTGNVIRYTRTFEVKELSVPVSKAEELKKLYRIIATDERNTAILKLAAK